MMSCVVVVVLVLVESVYLVLVDPPIVGPDL